MRILPDSSVSFGPVSRPPWGPPTPGAGRGGRLHWLHVLVTESLSWLSTHPKRGVLAFEGLILSGVQAWFRQASHPLHGDGVGLFLDLPRLHQRTVQVEYDCVNHRSTLQTDSADGCLMVRAEINPYRPASKSSQRLPVAYSLAVGLNAEGEGSIGNRQILAVISRQLEE